MRAPGRRHQAEVSASDLVGLIQFSWLDSGPFCQCIGTHAAVWTGLDNGRQACKVSKFIRRVSWISVVINAKTGKRPRSRARTPGPAPWLHQGTSRPATAASGGWPSHHHPTPAPARRTADVAPTGALCQSQRSPAASAQPIGTKACGRLYRSLKRPFGGSVSVVTEARTGLLPGLGEQPQPPSGK